MFVLVLAILMTAAAGAATCDTADLNESATGPLRQVPIYDQDGTGTCYAQTAATLINFEYAKAGRKPREWINPIFASWANKYEDNSLYGADSTRGGEASDVIASLRKVKNCPAYLVEGSLTDMKKAGHLTDAQLVSFLEHLYENYPTVVHADTFKSVLDRTIKDEKMNACYTRTLAEDLKSRELAGIAATVVLKHLFEGCPVTQRDDVTVPPVSTLGTGPDSAVRKRVDEALERGAPIGISICSEMLATPTLRPLRWENPSLLNRGSNGNIKGKCGNHAVTITARRQLGNSCMYLVRNSWGASWHARGMSCACITWGDTYQEVCESALMAKEFLGCWYKAEDLMANIQDTTVIQEK